MNRNDGLVLFINRPLRLLILCIFLFCTKGILAQDTLDRPKVGLVLSGGSAHGLAHVGVLKYLDEIGLEVDYITGTSMGAVIGGLYAMGYSADEIEAIADHQEWKLLMSNKTPLNEIAPIEKKNHERIPLTLYWKNDRFKLPSAFIRGQRLDINLSNLFLPAHRIQDYDDLYIPFRCVAVDLEDGSVKVFSSGFLGESIRASMAIPSVFPPKILNDRIYVDGGLIRNFPVEEVIEMGADIVIGVYVGGVKMNREDMGSMFDILEHSAFMAGILDSEIQIRKVDLLLTPKVKRMKKFDFTSAEIFIQKGYESAIRNEDQLMALKSKLDSFPDIVRNNRLNLADDIKVDYIHIGEKNPAVKKLISRQLVGLESNHFSSLDLAHCLSLVYGTKNFSKSFYSFNNNKNQLGLEILTANTNDYILGISLNRFELYNASLILNSEVRNVLGELSSLRMDVRLSENSGAQLSYYKRMNFAPSYMISMTGKFELYELPFVNADVQDRLYKYRDGKYGLSIIKEWRNSFMFALGYQFQYDKIKPQVFKVDGIKKYVSRRHVAYLNFSHNNLDKQYYATSGLYINLTPSWILKTKVENENQDVLNEFIAFPEKNSYVRADFAMEYYYSLSTKTSIELSSNGRLSSGESFLDHYKVGGPFQVKNYNYGFIGLEESEYIIGDHVSIKAALRFLVRDFLYITPTVQFLYGEDYLHYIYDRKLNTTLLGYGIQFGVDSPIGPISLDIGYTNKTDEFNLNLGIGFRHIY